MSLRQTDSILLPALKHLKPDCEWKKTKKNNNSNLTSSLMTGPIVQSDPIAVILNIWQTGHILQTVIFFFTLWLHNNLDLFHISIWSKANCKHLDVGELGWRAAYANAGGPILIWQSRTTCVYFSRVLCRRRVRHWLWSLSHKTVTEFWQRRSELFWFGHDLIDFNLFFFFFLALHFACSGRSSLCLAAEGQLFWLANEAEIHVH